jgi:hypothetical protein
MTVWYVCSRHESDLTQYRRIKALKSEKDTGSWGLGADFCFHISFFSHPDVNTVRLILCVFHCSKPYTIVYRFEFRNIHWDVITKQDPLCRKNQWNNDQTSVLFLQDRAADIALIAMKIFSIASFQYIKNILFYAFLSLSHC